MLVLTRKLDEQILIGDDIKVTLIRVRGNTVRIGIEAPQEVRIVRGELETFTDQAADAELSDREQAFAHPQPAAMKMNRPKSAKNRLPKKPTTPKRVPSNSKTQLYVGTVKQSGDAPKLSRAPLANFVAAS